MITLVLGGARSGKSEVAERLAARMGAAVTYVATIDAGEDPEMAARIAEHRDRRPASWRTEEAGAELPRLLLELEGPVLVDALGGWVASSPRMEVDTGTLCAALAARRGDTVVVSEEVGMGVHPTSVSGRRFRDVLGALNRAVASVADDVLLVMAGRVLPLEDAAGFGGGGDL
ncbi:MAG TPA: bifunctional adenosylcobinamide kinase/adenosylcobinamide-phosphate guanylyltransferase [Acidimicrobiales bacterium]|nr:bifunctional adenosylcobinamide kinase/adenosylcobinamide-phosphate guanylyltransferase [Acidimicrobiales bacterium]